MPPKIVRSRTKDTKTGKVTRTKTNERTGVTKTVTRGGGKGRSVSYSQGLPKIYRDNPEWLEEDAPAYKKGGSTKTRKSLRKYQGDIGGSQVVRVNSPEGKLAAERAAARKTEMQSMIGKTTPSNQPVTKENVQNIYNVAKAYNKTLKKGGSVKKVTAKKVMVKSKKK